MANFKVSDLVYTGYKTTARPDDNPFYRGGTDYEQLNRHEAYEMIYFINHFMDKHGLTTIAQGQKIERLIHEKLPHGIRGHQSISNWLFNNWNNY